MRNLLEILTKPIRGLQEKKAQRRLALGRICGNIHFIPQPGEVIKEQPIEVLRVMTTG